MSQQKNPRQQHSLTEDAKSRISQLLDQAVATARAEKQCDPFFQKTAAHLKAEDENCIPLITRRVLRADYGEKEILLQILKYFKGVEHIQFLQDLLDREVITARMGRIILDIFNKSDMIIESGTTSRLLDLDALSQKITHSVLSGAIDTSVVELFVSRPAREQEGIMIELIAETGPKCALFLAKLFEINKPAGQAMLKLAVSEPTEESYRLLIDMYDKTGNKDILKIAKKGAHALRQKGVDVGAESGKEPQEAVFKSAELPSPRAFTTMIDAEGFQLLFMLKPISQHEIKIFNTMLSQEKGIQDIEAITALRRETRQLIANLLNDKKIEFIEIPVAHGAFLISEATALVRQQGGILSPVLVQWNMLFADFLPAPGRPAIYDVLQPDEIRADGELAGKAIKLLDITEIPYWFIATGSGRDIWRTTCRQGAQQAETPAEAALKLATELFFTDGRLKAFVRRLEEQAYIFHLKGRIDAAKIAFAQALDLATPGLKPTDNAFCREIIRRGVEYFLARDNKAGA